VTHLFAVERESPLFLHFHSPRTQAIANEGCEKLKPLVCPNRVRDSQLEHYPGSRPEYRPEIAPRVVVGMGSTLAVRTARNLAPLLDVATSPEQELQIVRCIQQFVGVAFKPSSPECKTTTVLYCGIGIGSTVSWAGPGNRGVGGEQLRLPGPTSHAARIPGLTLLELTRARGW